MSTKLENEINKLNFEESLKELEKIVSSLENGQVSLDNAIESYTRGTKLKDHCEKKLKDAKLIIEQITENPDK